MKKSETLNTFDQGLVMDINPLVAPKDGVCNALNATLITMNGNENVLQNDMGNGRVETAYLPEGYIPLGTTELGGIIYIVSYNPSNDRCQIGCFPSPERNIEKSEDELSLNQSLTNTDFDFRDASQGSLIYNIKKELNKDIKFNPGDKFIVYSDKINEICDQLYNENDYLISEKTKLKNFYNKVKFHTIKLDIGTITDSGKTIKFDNLKQYVIKPKSESNPEYKYHICQSKNIDDKIKVDLDNYRSLVSQPYNIFSSKVSGQLVLLAELVQFNDFDIQIKHSFKTESINEPPESKEYKAYQPSVFASFSGDYPFVPYGVICKFDLIQESTDNIITSTINKEFDVQSIGTCLENNNFNTSNYNLNLGDLFQTKSVDESVAKRINELSKEGYFEKPNREKHILNYTFTPCMNWGKVSHLEVKGQIDLSKIGTGYIGLNTWKYYNDSKNCNLTWGLEVYEEEGNYIKSVEIIFKRISKCANGITNFEETTYNISNKNSYFGVFYETIPFNQKHYKLTKPLKDNSLYLATIKVTYGNDGTGNNDAKNDIRTFNRFLYTNALFNEYYKDYQDFDSLQPEFDVDFKFDYTKDIKESSVTSYGITKAKYDKEIGENEGSNKTNLNKNNSLSAIQTQRKYNIVGNINVFLKNDYNTFKLNIKNDDFIIKQGTFSTTSKSTDKYTDVSDMDSKDYFKLTDEIYDNESIGEFLQYKLSEKNYEDNSQQIKNLPTNVINQKESTFKLKEGVENNNYQFTLDFITLNMAKAYCTKEQKDLSYRGQFIPLAYDKTTFSNYNLEWHDKIEIVCEPTEQIKQWSTWKLNDQNEWIQVTDNELNKIGKFASGWLPSTVGLYGFGEGRSRKGNFWIGGWDSKTDTISEPLSARTEDNIKMNFTTNPDVITKEQSSGWNNTTMFCYYYYSYKFDDKAESGNQYESGTEDHFIQNTSSVDLPENKTAWSETANHYNLYADPGAHWYRLDPLDPSNPDNDQGRTRWRAGNSRLQLFMRSSDNQYFYPVNYSHIGPNHLNFGSNNEDYGKLESMAQLNFAIQIKGGLIHSPVYSLMRSDLTFYYLIQHFADFLNNIYRYSSVTAKSKMILPKYIYWMDEIEYDITYTLDITPNTNSIISTFDTNHDLINGNPFIKTNIDVYIQLDDGELTIKEYAEKLLDQNFSKVDISNNVNVKSVNVKNANFAINIKQIDNTSGKTLRDKMLNDTGSTLGTAIIDYNGKDVVGESLINIDPKRLYMRINNGESIEIKEANEFNPITINYLNGEVSSYGGVLESNRTQKLNLNQKFTLDQNNLLVLNSPPTTEHHFQLQHNWDNEDSEADGYQKVILLSQYQSY